MSTEPPLIWRTFYTRNGTAFLSHEWGGGMVTISGDGYQLATVPRSDVVEFVRQLDDYFNGGPVKVTSKAAEYIQAASQCALEGEREVVLAYLRRLPGIESSALEQIEAWLRERNGKSPTEALGG